MTNPQNLLYIISDEHSYSALGCYGNSVVKTPHLDRLAEQGTRFTNAYCPSPTCVPCRASLATGQYVHQIGSWSSAQPYEGQAKSWMMRLRESGHHVASIGKLHFRNSHPRNGFSEEIIPLHIVNELGWVKGLMRDELPSYNRETLEYATEVGPGESSYTKYDRAITKEAKAWLEKQATQQGEKPWALFLSFVCPHYPLFAPEEFFSLYNPKDIELPASFYPEHWPTEHPFLKQYYKFYNYHEHFDEKQARLAIASYYGLCSFLDDNIGQVLSTLEACGLANDTRVIYSSDHGDLMGEHGQWTKMCMYEGSAGVPLIMSGEGVPKNHVVDTAVSLIDIYPTILENCGVPLTESDEQLSGESLFKIIVETPNERVAFCEMHDGLTSGFFMLRTSPHSVLGNWKYIYYPGYPPQLFNLTDDPLELNDLGQAPETAVLRQKLESLLRKIIDPEAIDAQAKKEQSILLEKLGGKNAILAKEDTDFGYTPIRIK